MLVFQRSTDTRCLLLSEYPKYLNVQKRDVNSPEKYKFKKKRKKKRNTPEFKIIKAGG